MSHSHRMYCAVVLLLTLLIACSPAAPQPTATVAPAGSEAGCPQIVAEAMETTDLRCTNTGRNQICYGNVSLQVTPQSGVDSLNFDEPGDIIDLASLQSLNLASMNTDTQEWGVALMAVQANLPDSLPGQNVTILLFGNVEIETIPGVEEEFAFTFQSGIGDAPCAEAPDSGILVQTPAGAGEVHFRANGVDIQLASTAYLQAQNGVDMAVNVVEGQAEVTAQNITRRVGAGTRTNVPLDANRQPAGPPSPPVPYQGASLQTLPVTHLARPVGITSVLLSSSFAADAEGWSAPVDGTEIAYMPADATSDGHICADDTSDDSDWYFQAPEAWLGDQSAAYGGALRFTLRQSAEDAQYDADDILITGGGITLKFNTAENPSTDWTLYQAPLVETAGWVNTSTGAAPTREEMLAVLSAVTELRIRGEYREGGDTGCLDEAQLVSVLNPLVRGQAVQIEPTQVVLAATPVRSVAGQVSGAEIGLEIDDSIGTAGEVDTYTFEAQAGQRVYFDALDSDGVAVWSLADPSGTQVFTHALVSSVDPGLYVVDRTGTYTISVQGSGDRTGAYGFKVWDVAELEISIAIGDTVSDGVPVAGAGNIESAGGQDIYLFDGQAGQRVYFDALNSDGVAVWSLHDSEGRALFTHALVSSVDPGEVTLNVSGVYSILVHGNGDRTGPYRFKIWEASELEIPIRVGDAVSDGVPVAGAGNIESAGGQDIYLFDGQAGQRVYFDALNSDGVAVWSLHDSEGRALFTHALVASVDPGLMTLPQTGAYTILVHGSGARTGPYEFQLLDGTDMVTAVPPTPAPAISTEIGFEVSDSIDLAGEVDTYTFDAEPGQPVYFDAQEGDFYLRWTLVDESGEPVFEGGRMTGDPGFYALERGGTYTITVYGDENVTGPYRFQVWDVPAPQTFDIAIGDIVAENAPGPGAGNIESPGVQDIYTFSAEAGQTVYFDTQVGGNFYLRWKVEDETDFAIFDGGRMSGDPGVYPLEHGGTYTLTVYGDAESVGTYSFQLWDVPPPQNFTFNIGDVISDGVPQAGAGNIESPGARDIFSFTADAGQIVYFDTLAGGNFYLRWTVTDANDVPVFDGGRMSGDPGVYTLERGGTYTLTVYGDEDNIGAYQFQLWDVPAPQTFTFNIGDVISDGVPEAGAGNIESPGARDIYTFMAEAGQTVYFDTQAGGNFYLRWTVEDETGSLIFDGGRMSGDPGVYTLELGGDYTLTVYGDEDTVGAYQFQVSDVPPPQTFEIGIGDAVAENIPSEGAGNIETPGVQDWYTFVAQAGNVTVTPLEGDFYLRWRIEDEAGEVVYEGGRMTDQPATATLASAGTYTLVVYGDADTVGTYSIQLAQP